MSGKSGVDGGYRRPSAENVQKQCHASLDLVCRQYKYHTAYFEISSRPDPLADGGQELKDVKPAWRLRRMWYPVERYTTCRGDCVVYGTGVPRLLRVQHVLEFKNTASSC